MPKKIKNEGRLARTARTVKMLIKGRRYKMSKEALKKQDEAKAAKKRKAEEEKKKKKKATFASTLVKYVKPRKKPPGLTQTEWDRMNKKRK